MRVLVIDDSKAMRSIIKNILLDCFGHEFGFEIVEAGAGKEALEQLASFKDISLALVDWNLPDMTGHDFILTVRSKKEYNDVPLMMVTTETALSQVAMALKAGANEYLMKPFTKEMFLDKLTILGIPYK